MYHSVTKITVCGLKTAEYFITSHFRDIDKVTKVICFILGHFSLLFTITLVEKNT